MGRKIKWCEACEERTIHEVVYDEPDICTQCGMENSDDEDEWGDQPWIE